MATAEATTASLGPRYAPDDPTLPKPWKGLIDGSTGLLYYWNPETNVTQYEKPAALPPPLPPGPPPAGSTPKLAPIPVAHSMQPNGMMIKQQMTQATPQEVQQVSQLPQQLGSMAAQVSDQHDPQQQGSQLGQSMQHPGKFAPQMRPQMMQYPVQEMPQHPGQPWLQQPGQQMQQQAIQQMSQQSGQQSAPHENSQTAQPQGHQYPHQQLQYTAYQQGIPPQGKQSSHQQTQVGAQGKQFGGQQDYNKAAITKREEAEFPPGNQTGVSPSNFQQTGASSSQNLPGGTNSMKTGAHLGHVQQFGGSSVTLQQPNPMVQLQQTGTDIAHHQHGPRFENQMGPQMMHNNPPNLPPFGLSRGYEDNIHCRTGNDYYFNGNKDGPVMGPQQPKLAALPMGRNPQV